MVKPAFNIISDMKKICLLLPVFLLLLGCKNLPEMPDYEELPSLQTAYHDNFLIGTALGRRHINGEIPEAMTLVEREFNSLTPENDMKWMYIHPQPDSFAFEIADQFVEYGEQHEMFLVGHTLVWHNQLAPWVENISDSVELARHLQHHIHTIVSRYQGKIHGYDVLNEALNEDGSLRETIFLNVLGEDYIRMAFEFAGKADSDVNLYYNDYNMTKPAKRRGAIELIKKLQAAGVKIDGIGMQAHWGLNYPKLRQIEKSIEEYAALGIDVMITELDITVLPNPNNIQGADLSQNGAQDERLNPYLDGLPQRIQDKLAKRYRDIFEIFLKHQDKISRVTFWGVNDGHSWKNNWPVRGRTDYPLLFDRKFRPKQAWYQVLELKTRISMKEIHISGKGKAENTFDAIVVGSGITGGIAAKELTEKGLKVLVLERGREVKHVQDYNYAMTHPWEMPNSKSGFP